MTTKTQNLENENSLLNSEERAIISQIATKDPPFSQRAQALLAIDEGTTQVEAGIRAGLTKGQVRYWLTKFRRDRTDIFPEELLNQAQQEDTDSPPSPEEPLVSPDTPDLEQVTGGEEAQQEMLDALEATGPVDLATARQKDTPKAKKKLKQKSKKKPKQKSKKKPKQKSKKKPKQKSKKSKKEKKTKKGKKSTKEIKKKKPKKVKGAKGKSSKKTKKKSKK